MKTQTATERFYRLQSELEGFQRGVERVMQMQQDSILESTMSECEYLDRFHAVVVRALSHLEDAIAEARSHAQAQLLWMELMASQELIARSPEKMRREKL